MAPAQVNDSSRGMMGRLAELVKDLGGVTTVGGTANAITLTANASFTALATGQMVTFKAGSSNSAATTVNVNSIGAKAIRKFTVDGDVALSANDIIANGRFILIYDSAANAAAGAWILVNPTAAGGSSFTLTSTSETANAGPTFTLYRDSASPAANDFLGDIYFDGEDTAGNQQTYARIVARADNVTSTTEGGRLYFQTYNNGSSGDKLILSGTSATFSVPIYPSADNTLALGASSQAWSDLFLGSGAVINFDNTDTITHSAGAFTFSSTIAVPTANVDVGAISVVGATAGARLASTGALALSGTGTGSHTKQVFYNANGGIGSIVTNASATAFNTSSDKRKKTNLRTFDSGAILEGLDIWHFDWKAGGSGYGVMAQDANEVFPDAVSYDAESDNYGVDYSKYVPLLLAEVKALRQRVAALEAAV
jgi:hypothetical protein